MSKAKKPKAQKMVANDEGQPTHRAKVNMHLPTGQHLVAGEGVKLSKDSHAHLTKSFGESLHHIVEDIDAEDDDSGAPEPSATEPNDEPKGEGAE